jgi:2-aminoadipate transaminase
MCESLRALCPDCKFREPEGGYFVWVKLPSGVDAHDLYNEGTSRHGVAFTPGSRCALPSSDAGESLTSTKEYIRLSFAFYDDEEIREGIQRLADALNAVRAP